MQEGAQQERALCKNGAPKNDAVHVYDRHCAFIYLQEMSQYGFSPTTVADELATSTFSFAGPSAAGAFKEPSTTGTILGPSDGGEFGGPSVTSSVRVRGTCS